MQHFRFIIVGAGPTGLGAAWRLHELDHQDWLIVEAAAEAGGLARSFVDDKGFTWDIGGHVQFSHYEYFDRVMDSLLGTRWLEPPPARILDLDARPLHSVSVAEQSASFARGRSEPLPARARGYCYPVPQNRCRPHFKDWILSKFGNGIADVFMLPYNFKVWAHDPSVMNATWVGDRVAPTDLRKVLKNLVYQTDDRAWGPNNTFRFPKRGGTGAIWKACAARLPGNRQAYNSSGNLH